MLHVIVLPESELPIKEVHHRCQDVDGWPDQGGEDKVAHAKDALHLVLLRVALDVHERRVKVFTLPLQLHRRLIVEEERLPFRARR